NFGRMINRGVELTLDANRRVSSDFQFSVRGTFTYAVNKVLEADETEAIKNSERSYTGNPTGQIFGLIAEGLFTEADFDESGKVIGPEPRLGVVRVGDI